MSEKNLSNTLSKVHTPKEYESFCYERERACFSSTHNEGGGLFSMCLPPPNVTGTLHLGHALNTTLQDILARFKRLQGYQVLWQGGMDHAGIATQMVVERALAKEGIKRSDLTREAFLEHVWVWKEQSGDTILKQQEVLGASIDWSRTRFTMDEGLCDAVTHVFVSLYKQGLIYRSKRLVNWDPHFKTAISDLEIMDREMPWSLWHIKYPLEEDPTQGIVVATTRPETLFADACVAVHPEDDRFRHLIGKRVRLPLTDRLILIIADNYCDPEKGSGAVKITPAHDFNDFEVGVRHNLPLLNMLDEGANLNENVPKPFQGLCLDEARTKVIAELKENGLLVQEEPYIRKVPFGDRSHVEIQPYLTDQWFVDAKVLSHKAIEVVKTGEISFYPKQWENTFFEWMNSIQPWCISRQIWWGHQIPAWYGPDRHIFVEESEQEAKAAALLHYGKEVTITRDEDVLDTWFSSALFPFSTLGWPNDEGQMKEFYDRFYPTTVLVTGFDIIFFWVARMIMMGCHFTKKVPFKHVYIHNLIRDEKGDKMSKSKGNSIDPLDLSQVYGTDALRLTLSSLTVPGRDVKLGVKKVEEFRNFITKIWNTARFLLINECVFLEKEPFPEVKHPLNAWILNRLRYYSRQIQESLDIYRFDYASANLYTFLWDTFCDFYVEASKTLLKSSYQEETKCVAGYIFREFLKIAHPFIPFITSHLFTFFSNAKGPLLAGRYDSLHEASQGMEEEASQLILLIQRIRSMKGLLGIGGHVRLKTLFYEGSFQETNRDWVLQMGRFETLSLYEQVTEASVLIPLQVATSTYFMDVSGHIDSGDVLTLLDKKENILKEESGYLKNKLQNEVYQKAKPELFEKDEKLLILKTEEISMIRVVINLLDKKK